MDALPAIEAHSPETLRNEMLTLGSFDRSSVLPDSVFVWKSRSIPPASCCAFVRLDAKLGAYWQMTAEE